MEDIINCLEKLCKSNLFVGGYDWIDEFCKATEKNCLTCTEREICQKKMFQFIDKVRIMLKSYLQLDNVSFLFGTGSSLHLGAKSIKNIPQEIEVQIKSDVELFNLFDFLVKQYQKGYMVERDYNKEIKIPLEDFINYLIALEFTLNYSTSFGFNNNDEKVLNINLLPTLVAQIKQALFELCDLDSNQSAMANAMLVSNIENEHTETKKELGECEPSSESEDPTDNTCKDNKINHSLYYYHQRFLKALLQRPLNLRRANIFTINYDLAFEKTFDDLGVHYIDGFTGFHNRVFRPEVYEYDFYYPGSTTEGKVRRIERAVRYFKLHGSISWVGEEKSASNIYGLSEKPIELIRQDREMQGNIMIYPSSMKKRYTLDFPYSELFRHFAAAISQPQSVLFCVGYSFSDEHINDIIYQALAIPSFTLIIVDYRGTDNPEISRLKSLADPRIIILQGEYLGDFKTFSTELMPNFHEMDIREKVAATLAKLYSQDEQKPGGQS